MSKKVMAILPLAVALAALGAQTTTTNSKTSDQSQTGEAAPVADKPVGTPNAFFAVGEDLLGFIITEQADGTLVAFHSSHRSHSSHSSHQSHSSHFSGR